MEKTKEALKTLILGEREAVSKYRKYSDVAKEEGYLNTALLFKALVYAEEIHIKNHLNALGESFQEDNVSDIVLGNTLDNLKNSLEGEVLENKSLYPRLIKSIKSEIDTQYGKVAKLSMSWAQKVEKEHAKLLKKAIKAIKTGNDLQCKNIFYCQVCGNVELDWTGNDECKICGHDSIFFRNVIGEY